MDRLLGVPFELHWLAALLTQRSFGRRAKIALAQALFKKATKEASAFLSQPCFHFVVRRPGLIPIPSVEIIPQIRSLLQKLASCLLWRLPRSSSSVTHGLPPIGTIVS
jgi:hypothetical protein